MQPFAPPLRVPKRTSKKESDMTFNVFVAAPGDQAWAMIASGIRRHRPDAAILRVKDGQQAMRFLFCRGLLTEAPETPHLVVLAGNLPAISTEAVVARLRQHPRTCTTPVIVIGRRREDADLAKAFEQQLTIQVHSGHASRLDVRHRA